MRSFIALSSASKCGGSGGRDDPCAWAVDWPVGSPVAEAGHGGACPSLSKQLHMRCIAMEPMQQRLSLLTHHEYIRAHKTRRAAIANKRVTKPQCTQFIVTSHSSHLVS